MSDPLAISAPASREARAAPATTRPLYLALGVFIAALGVSGFWRSYFGPLLAGSEVDKLPLIHFHAVVYVGWLALFNAQAAFAAIGRIDWHLTLGRVGIAYGVAVIAVGLLVGFGMFVVRVRAGAAPEAIGRLFGPVLDMLIFAPLFAAAVHYRHRPELHKRLMTLATTTLLIAAVTRLQWFLSSLVLVQFVWSAPIIAAMAYDYVRHRIVHPVYVGGVVLLLLESPAVRLVARNSDAWRSFGEWLAGMVQ